MKVVTVSTWLNFGRPTPPGRGSAAGWKFLAPPYYSQCTVSASPLSAFFISFIIIIIRQQPWLSGKGVRLAPRLGSTHWYPYESFVAAGRASGRNCCCALQYLGMHIWALEQESTTLDSDIVIVVVLVFYNATHGMTDCWWLGDEYPHMFLWECGPFWLELRGDVTVALVH